MRQEDVREGRYVRLLTEHHSIPAGSLGIVETVITSREGEFCFTVRWLNAPAGTRSRPIADRSLNLWLSDIEKFEPVYTEEARSIMSAPRPSTPDKRAKPRQLGLFEDI
jgi:hypothetical protein